MVPKRWSCYIWRIAAYAKSFKVGLSFNNNPPTLLNNLIFLGRCFRFWPELLSKMASTIYGAEHKCESALWTWHTLLLDSNQIIYWYSPTSTTWNHPIFSNYYWCVKEYWPSRNLTVSSRSSKTFCFIFTQTDWFDWYQWLLLRLYTGNDVKIWHVFASFIILLFLGGSNWLEYQTHWKCRLLCC